jgi:hypothetical protein
MSLIILPTNGGYPTGGYSLPERVSFVVADTDGSGGSVYLNGRGVTTGTVAGAYDLRDIFISAGLLFNSIPLLNPFRSIPPVAQLEDVQNQLLKGLEVTFYGITGGPAAPLNLRIATISGLGGAPVDVPFLQIIAAAGGEGYTGDAWRVDVRLRHSVTN